jgi:hypothetical protein
MSIKSPIPRHTVFPCNFCSAEIQEEMYWFESGNSSRPVHYHCAYQMVDRGYVQMQLFSLEEYLNAV